MAYRLSTDFINRAVTRVLLLFDRPLYSLVDVELNHIEIISFSANSSFFPFNARSLRTLKQVKTANILL